VNRANLAKATPLRASEGLRLLDRGGWWLRQDTVPKWPPTLTRISLGPSSGLPLPGIRGAFNPRVVGRPKAWTLNQGGRLLYGIVVSPGHRTGRVATIVPERILALAPHALPADLSDLAPGQPVVLLLSIRYASVDVSYFMGETCANYLGHPKLIDGPRERRLSVYLDSTPGPGLNPVTSRPRPCVHGHALRERRRDTEDSAEKRLLGRL